MAQRVTCCVWPLLCPLGCDPLAQSGSSRAQVLAGVEENIPSPIERPQPRTILAKMPNHEKKRRPIVYACALNRNVAVARYESAGGYRETKTKMQSLGRVRKMMSLYDTPSVLPVQPHL